MEGQLNLTQQNVTGRIIKSLGGFYYVAAEQEDRVIECRARGVFRQQNIKPCVGDWVEVELTDEGKGYVVKVQPRKNSLVRPPLANLDQLVLVVSIADPAPNAFVLDQLIAIAEYQDIEPVIVVTKCDLADPSDFAKIYTDAGFTVCLTRTLEHQGIEQVMQVLQGGYVADTPGFSAVDLEKFQVILKDELAGCFREMRPYEGKCRFTGCSHTKEKGCAVLEAVQEGKIAPSRHQSYVALYEQAKNIKEWEIGRETR